MLHCAGAWVLETSQMAFNLAPFWSALRCGGRTKRDFWPTHPLGMALGRSIFGWGSFLNSRWCTLPASVSDVAAHAK